MHTISHEEFNSVQIYSGTILKAEAFPRARNPSYKVWVDFGSKIGILKTSAQITENYSPESLLGLKVMGCINLGKKNIAGFESEFLLLGFSDSHGFISLALCGDTVPNGERLQ